MSGFTTVALGALLGAVFLSLVAILLWQEAKRRRTGEQVVYVVPEARGFIKDNLAPEVLERLGAAGISRIVEWEVFYLQGLAQKDRRIPVETVAGGSDQAVAYVRDQIAERHGIDLATADIRAVLELEAAYLQSIGAVGQRVGTLSELAEEEKPDL